MPVVLPSRYRFAHDYSIFLHDLIVGKLKVGLESRIFEVRLDLAPHEARSIEDLEGEELYRWMEEHKDETILWEMDFKGIIPALTTDFCHYVLEALRASKRGKLTVAYSLLRKPFQDNLFYLEWLLADLPDLMERFRTKGPEALEVKGLPVARRKEVIEGAIAKMKSGHPIDPEFIYDLRYNRAIHFSLAGSFDKAIHLITTGTHLRTDHQNFNFVFSGPEAWESQWSAIYRTIPLLLYHAVMIVDELMSLVADWDDASETWYSTRREVGFILYGESVSSAPSRSRIGEARDVVGELLRIVCPACPQCQTSFSLQIRNLRSFCTRGVIRCDVCRESIHLDLGSGENEPNDS